MKKVMVINCGSSSVKCKLYEVAGGGDFRVLAAGSVERIGELEAGVHLSWSAGEVDTEEKISSHHEALETLERLLLEKGILPDFASLDVVGHRVVHGGERFSQPVVVDETVLKAIRELVPLAPLHNPYNLEGIQTLRKKAPDLVQVAVFDTAFHQAMPETGYRYALPEDLYRDHGVRRYGFHGISHAYLARTAAGFLGRDSGDLNLVSLHLGNGASAAAIKGGRCVDTSMGMTPMEGLVMGTRSGDVDPGVLFYLERECGFSPQDLDSLLNRQSGLKGLCGDNDMRTVLRRRQEGDPAATTAFAIFCYRLKKYIGAYSAILGRLDAVIFSGGIGARSPEVREEVCRELKHLGISLDREANQSVDSDIAVIDDGRGPVRILSLVTDEEVEIARQAFSLARSR